MKDKESHRIAVTCIIYNKKGQYLVTKRSPNKKVHPNKWTVPGGGLTIDDYITTKPSHDDQWYGVLEKALRREIMEEVNVDVGIPSFLLDLAFVRPDGIPVVVLSYYALYVSGEVKLDQDAVDHGWFTLDEVRKLDMLSGMIEEIEMVDTILKKK